MRTVLHQTFKTFHKLVVVITGISALCFLPHCTSGPPSSPLPPSESDLNVLGPTYLCQTKKEAQASWLKPGSQEWVWGNGREYFQEISLPNKQGQWIVFNKDETVVGVVTVFPDGLSLDDYPTLQRTLSQLPPAREFYLTSSQLLEGQAPDSATLYRTGKAKTTHQYYIRHRKGQDDELIMAVFVLDPYERLLDGSHPRFLSYLDVSSAQAGQKFVATAIPSQTDKDFLGLQQFARGEIALFASCGIQDPNIALDAYQQAIQHGLSEKKPLAEAHHRLGLAFSHLGKLAEAQQSIEAALVIQPHASNILNSYGSLLVKRKKTLAGIQAYERALALQPAYAQARFNLANVFESINPKRAIQEYETFIVLAEDNPDYSAKVGIAKAKINALEGP